MSHMQKRRPASHTRCARRSLVELTAAASRAVDDGLFVLSSGIAGSNPRSEHTGEKTSYQTILARQAMAPSPVAVLESRNAAAPRKDELLDSDATTETWVTLASRSAKLNHCAPFRWLQFLLKAILTTLLIRSGHRPNQFCDQPRVFSHSPFGRKVLVSAIAQGMFSAVSNATTRVHC